MSYNKNLKMWSNQAASSNFKSIGECFFNAMNQKPFDLVQVNHDDGIPISRMEMKKLAVTAAEFYQKAGLKFGDVIVFVSSYQTYVAPAIFGANLIGCPVNLLDYDMDTENFENLLMFLKPKIICCETRYLEKIQTALKHDNLVCDLFLTDSVTDSEGVRSVYKIFEEPSNEETFSLPKLGNANDVLAFILCSSAASGPYKLIKINHQNVLDTQIDLFKGNIFSVAPLFLATSLNVMYNSLKSGACNFITNKEPSFDMFVEIEKKHKIECVVAHPNFLTNLLLHPSVDSTFKYIAKIITYGHGISETMEQKVLKTFQNCKIYNMYSLTECFGIVAHSVPDSQKLIHQLKIVPGINAKIVNDSGNNMGPNEMGQLYIKYNNNNKIQGYYTNKKANEESFDKDCWFNTGDLAMIDEEAFITITERKKNVISVGFTDVFPADIEKVIMEMPGVVEVVCVEYPNIAFGFVPAAAIVRKDKSLTEMIVQNYVKATFDELPEAQLLGGVYFVNEIPKTSSGKVQHFKVKETILHMKKSC